jgi:hypothetical protein
MNRPIVTLIGSLAAALLLALAGGQALLAQGKAAPSVTPAVGVPGVHFLFTASGFRGATPADDAKQDPGERLAYWVNTPLGEVIATEPRSGTSDYGNSTKPLLGQANGFGDAAIRWAAPTDAVPGAYSMVIHGLKSDTEVVIPFALRPDGSQTVVQDTVTPRAGAAGTAFQFIATGFDDAGPDAGHGGRRGEQVAYWFNTPDGGVITTEPRSGTSDYGNETKPLRHYADDEGVVNLVWGAPATLQPGIYSVVFHGRDSQHQVLIFFTIK